MSVPKWPQVSVKTMRGMKRGRDAKKPGDARYSEWVAEIQTTMPCGADIRDRLRWDFKDATETVARERGRMTIINRGDLHKKRCDTCKRIAREEG